MACGGIVLAIAGLTCSFTLDSGKPRDCFIVQHGMRDGVRVYSDGRDTVVAFPLHRIVLYEMAGNRVGVASGPLRGVKSMRCDYLLIYVAN